MRQDGGSGDPFYGAQPLQPTQTLCTNWRAPTVWTLRIGKQEIPAQWIIVDREFRQVA